MQDTDVTEIWNRLLSTPMQVMTEQERIVHAVNVFLIDFEQGGSWLYNASMSAMARKRRLAVKASSVALGHNPTPAVHTGFRKSVESAGQSPRWMKCPSKTMHSW